MVGASYRCIALVALELLAENGFMTEDDAKYEADVIDAGVRNAG